MLELPLLLLDESSVVVSTLELSDGSEELEELELESEDDCESLLDWESSVVVSTSESSLE